MRIFRFVGGAVLCANFLWCVTFALAPRTGHAQEIKFSYRVTLDGVTSDPLEFGLREDASQGLDDYDVPEPPPVPGATFDAFLAMFDGPASLPNRWRRDYRPTVSLLSDRVELWQFEFHSDAIGGEVTIDIDTIGAIPVPYELYIFGPGVYYEPVAAPDSVSFTVTENAMVFFWELRLADAVVAESTTWGGIKGLYR